MKFSVPGTLWALLLILSAATAQAAVLSDEQYAAIEKEGSLRTEEEVFHFALIRHFLTAL